MKRLRLLLRLLAIQRVLVKHHLDEFITSTHLLRPIRFLFYFSPSVWSRGESEKQRGVRIREALEELGPIYVKFGQSLSTRQDLLPTDIGKELAKLQDQVPPFSAAEAMAAITDAYGQPAEEVFTTFDSNALAAASIAQVHVATLPSGQEAIVKILRPGVQQQIARDLEVLYAIARLANRYWVDGRRLRPIEVVQEYDKTITNELDLMREAGNASQLRRNFQGSDKIYVPDIFWDYCRPSVMVMERIHGIPIRDIEKLRESKADIAKLAANGVEIFFTQVFRDNFFHADMHPGNIFVEVDDPANPRYAAVDFGIVGTLEERDRRYLAENFLAFFDRDYHRVAQLHVNSGWVPAITRVDELESAIRTVCEPVFNKPLKDISFGQVLLRLFQVARQFNMEVQPQLILLQKTLVQIEGLGRDLYPDLDLWETGQPVLRRWMTEQSGPAATAERIRRDLPDIRYTLQKLPAVARRLVDHALENEGRLPIPDKDQVFQKAQSQYLAIVGAILIVAATLLFGLSAKPVWLSWLTGCAGAVSLYMGRPRRPG